MITRNLHRLAKFIEVNQEVKSALEAKKPVVALESTIITHGMPRPYNIDTALEVEDIIRKEVTLIYFYLYNNKVQKRLSLIGYRVRLQVLFRINSHNNL